LYASAMLEAERNHLGKVQNKMCLYMNTCAAAVFTQKSIHILQVCIGLMLPCIKLMYQ